ncbi:MAG: sigma-54 dependent transcriptional regulator [Kangiellaceae bacterium]|nr:sigma-54 dependent transcriptional regulator [Kangiellaceae bacterium]
MGDRDKLLVIVDDEPSILSAIRVALRRVSASIEYFSDPLEALEFVNKNKPDMVISDQRMPDMLGTKLLDRIKAMYPKCVNVLLSAYNDFEDVSDAFNNNTIQKYLSKPWDNQELVHLVNQSINTQKNQKRKKGTTSRSFHGMLSNDIIMSKTFEQITKASSSNIPIFITGETGTGKELAAKACHFESSRNNDKFIAINCANFSESLMESQLFGHVKGAFTGAVSKQEGLLAASHKGTLFLDEITCLPLSLQAKLLRVLQEREFSAIGSNKVEQFEAQIITASSLPLRDAVSAGDFREDLFYRLDVISIKLPRLAERGKDAVLLAEHFLTKFSKSVGKIFEGFSTAAKVRLGCYSWPGNIRQLENLIHSLVVLNDGIEITDEMLKNGIPRESANGQSTVNNNSVIENTVTPFNGQIKPLWLAEKETIQNAIEHFNGNIPRASAALEVSPSTIYRKIQSWKKLTTEEA